MVAGTEDCHAGDAETAFEGCQPGEVRPQVEYRCGVAQVRDHPPGADVDDRGLAPGARLAAEDEFQLSGVRRGQRLDRGRWQRKSKVAVPVLLGDRQLNSADEAFLGQPALSSRSDEPGFQDGVRAAESGMSGKGSSLRGVKIRSR